MENIWWATGVTLFAGLGLGAIVSSLIAKHYEQRKLIFETKLIKYSNLIQSYQDAVIDNKSEALRQNYVSCQKQVELIGSDKVIALSQQFYKPQVIDQNHIRDSLVIAMREDLRKYS